MGSWKITPEVTHLLLVQLQNILALEEDLAFILNSGVIFSQPENGLGHNALAGAGFTDNTNDFAGADLHIDTVYSCQNLFSVREFDLQILNFQQWFSVHEFMFHFFFLPAVLGSR